MAKTKTIVSFPKFYICKYGAFYEGEELAHYCYSSNNHYYYCNNIILEKFIVHYNNYKPCLYFRFTEKSQKFTLPVEQLGIFYRKIRKKTCK